MDVCVLCNFVGSLANEDVFCWSCAELINNYTKAKERVITIKNEISRRNNKK